MSLIVTLILGNYVHLEFTLIGAFGIGLVEELGKAIIVALFINRIIANNRKHYILNGLLIGSAVGAGFDIFETAGYVFCAFLDSIQVDIGYLVYYGKSIQDMTSTIIIRGLTSLSGHVVWAAISGAALCLVSSEEPVSLKSFTSVPFIGAFIVPVTLHALWDWQVGGDLKLLILSIIPWFIVFIYINRGIKEINAEMTNVTETDKSLQQ